MPSSWTDVELGDVAAELTVGHVGPMVTEYRDRGVPFIRSTDIEPFRINRSELKFINPEFHAKLKKSALRPGDVVVVRTGKPGTAAMIPDELPDANCSDVVIVRAGPKLDARYLVYFINSSGQAHVNAHSGGAVQQHFNVGAARRMRLNLPPLEEQREIARVLGALDDKIELNRRMNGTLEALAQAVFKAWFVENAEGRWEEVPYGALIEASVSGDWGQEVADEEHTERVSIIRGADFPTVQNGSKEKVPVRYVTASKLKTRALKPGDLIIEISGGTKDRPTGRCVQVTENMLNWFDEPVVAASFCRLIRPKAGLSNYLALYMDYIYRQGKTWMYQNVSTGLSNFQMKEFLAKETLPLPPTNLLEKFNAIIDPITAKRTTSESQTLTALRDTLLPKLIRGEIRVKPGSKQHHK